MEEGKGHFGRVTEATQAATKGLGRFFDAVRT